MITLISTYPQFSPVTAKIWLAKISTHTVCTCMKDNFWDGTCQGHQKLSEDNEILRRQQNFSNYQ